MGNIERALLSSQECLDDGNKEFETLLLEHIIDIETEKPADITIREAVKGKKVELFPYKSSDDPEYDPELEDPSFNYRRKLILAEHILPRYLGKPTPQPTYMREHFEADPGEEDTIGEYTVFNSAVIYGLPGLGKSTLGGAIYSLAEKEGRRTTIDAFDPYLNEAEKRMGSREGWRTGDEYQKQTKWHLVSDILTAGFNLSILTANPRGSIEYYDLLEQEVLSLQAEYASTWKKFEVLEEAADRVFRILGGDPEKVRIRREKENDVFSVLEVPAVRGPEGNHRGVTTLKNIANSMQKRVRTKGVQGYDTLFLGFVPNPELQKIATSVREGVVDPALPNDEVLSYLRSQNIYIPGLENTSANGQRVKAAFARMASGEKIWSIRQEVEEWYERASRLSHIFEKLGSSLPCLEKLSLPPELAYFVRYMNYELRRRLKVTEGVGMLVFNKPIRREEGEICLDPRILGIPDY